MPTGIGEEAKEYLATETEDLKMISDYSGLNFNECLELDIYTYRFLLRDAYVEKVRKTEAGREYLEDCWLLRQTEPDRKKLDKRFGSGKRGGKA